MRLFTVCADGCRVLTVNAGNEQEAMDALGVLLGNVDWLSVRVASVDECLAWNASALEARRDTREAPLASTPARLPVVQATKKKPRHAVTASRASEGARSDAAPASRRVNRATGVQFPVG
jgi:hypothetical protein